MLCILQVQLRCERAEEIAANQDHTESKHANRLNICDY